VVTNEHKKKTNVTNAIEQIKHKEQIEGNNKHHPRKGNDEQIEVKSGKMGTEQVAWPPG